jgi:hypothetical protein
MENSRNKNVYSKITINVVEKCFECQAAAEWQDIAHPPRF